MIIVLKDNPDQKQLENLVSWLKSMGLDIHMSKGQSATIMGLIGDTAAVDIDLINALDIVETVKRVPPGRHSGGSPPWRKDRRRKLSGHRRALFSRIRRADLPGGRRGQECRRRHAARRCVQA